MTLFIFYASIKVLNRTRNQKFKRDYSNDDILNYLKGIYKILGRSPTSRELNKFPGPAPRTVMRRFGSWSKALNKAGMRSKTHQLKTGERSFIRYNWRKMTDKKIAKKLGVTEVVIKYYRMNYNLWKNRKGTTRSTYRREALRLYGQKCEVCGIGICEWHHIVPKSTKRDEWCILCPVCHSVITRKLVTMNNRNELKTKLLPYMRKIYSDLKI